MEKLFILLFSGTIFMSCAQTKQNDVTVEPEEKTYDFETIVDASIPWGMAWLPDGALLVTERSGDLIHFKDGKKSKVKNVPEVYARGQGGLLDIELHPNYAENGWIYIAFSSTEGEGSGGNTKIIRVQFDDMSLKNIEDIYKATPNTTKGQHFGCRIVFDNNNYLYFTIGDRGERDVNPQDITRDGGKVYRLHDDGTIPQDNPFYNEKNAKKAVYTYGHRNAQGMAKHPETGEIWLHEHGPKGGDEIHIVKKGANYGWPEITYGVNYNGTTITEHTEKPGMEQPLYYWLPSIAPSGMAFVTGDKYPEWKGHMLVGALKFEYLELVELNGKEVTGRQKIAEGIGRLRSVKMGPDGYIYMGVEGKGIVKIVPN